MTDMIDLGHNHFARFTSWAPDRELNPQYDGIPDIEKYGLIVEHPNQQNPAKPCVGSITFNTEEYRRLAAVRPPSAYNTATWEVHSLDPETLHVEPSLLCSCGDHGFIRNGRWEPC